jgi:hypothetical protein
MLTSVFPYLDDPKGSRGCNPCSRQLLAANRMRSGCAIKAEGVVEIKARTKGARICLRWRGANWVAGDQSEAPSRVVLGGVFSTTTLMRTTCFVRTHKWLPNLLKLIVMSLIRSSGKKLGNIEDGNRNRLDQCTWGFMSIEGDGMGQKSQLSWVRRA